MNVVVKHQFGLKEWADLCEQKDATIAALQARVQELESDPYKQGFADALEKVASDWASKEFRGHDEVQGVEVQAFLDTRHVHYEECRGVKPLQSQLTQRTAELEAVSNFIGVKYDAESKTWVSGQAPYLSAGTTKQEACIAAVDALRLACATWETKYRDLQAELERVRGLVKTYADAKTDFDDKRLQEDHHAWRERYNKLVEAENALLQHRQGMEG